MLSSFWEASWSFVGQSMPFSSLIVRIISIASLAFGFASLFPLVIFVVMDVSLYIWRLYWNRFLATRGDASAPVAHDATATARAMTTQANATSALHSTLQSRKHSSLCKADGPAGK